MTTTLEIIGLCTNPTSRKAEAPRIIERPTVTSRSPASNDL